MYYDIAGSNKLEGMLFLVGGYIYIIISFCEFCGFSFSVGQKVGSFSFAILYISLPFHISKDAYFSESRNMQCNKLSRL